MCGGRRIDSLAEEKNRKEGEGKSQDGDEVGGQFKIFEKQVGNTNKSAVQRGVARISLAEIG